MPTPAQRLAELGITLPPPVPALAAYVPFVVTGNLVFIAGQVPFDNGKVTVTGKLGENVTLDQGRAAARQCGIQLIAQINAACGGDLGRVERCVRLGGFVASAPNFYEQSKVINAASELMEQIFGEAGKHARTAVGVNVLPLNASVEIETVFAIAK